jgi:hypothetical protein
MDDHALLMSAQNPLAVRFPRQQVPFIHARAQIDFMMTGCGRQRVSHRDSVWRSSAANSLRLVLWNLCLTLQCTSVHYWGVQFGLGNAMFALGKLT